MRTIYRLGICFLMAIFMNEAIMVGFFDYEPNTTTTVLSLLVSSVMLFVSLFKSIIIEHIEMVIQREKDKG